MSIRDVSVSLPPRERKGIFRLLSVSYQVVQPIEATSDAVLDETGNEVGAMAGWSGMARWLRVGWIRTRSLKPVRCLRSARGRARLGERRGCFARLEAFGDRASEDFGAGAEVEGLGSLLDRKWVRLGK